MSAQNPPTGPTYFVSRPLKANFPLIDNDPHFKRVLRYGRPIDYVYAGVTTVAIPAMFKGMDILEPARVQRASWRQAMRMAWGVGALAGFLFFYQRVCLRFYGVSENAREYDMDMLEMVDKVKAGKPLYGVSMLSPYMQSVAARQSRYSPFFFHVLPWFNFVNHNEHGVDTAKYYRQAEMELEAERLARMKEQPQSSL